MRQERLFFTLLFAVVALLCISVMWPFLTYIVLAGILTYTLFPVFRFILKRTGMAQLSSALTIVFTLLLMVLPTVYLVSELAHQVSGAYDTFQAENIQRVADYLSGLTGNRVNFHDMMDSGLTQIRRSIVSLEPDLLGSVTEVLLGLFIMFFVMFYGFREGEGFLKRLKELLPLDPGLKDSLFYEVRTITQAVLYGQVMTALIQGALGGLGLFVFGISNWMFWGAIMMITAFVPVLGTPIIWVPAAVSLLLDGERAKGIGLLIFGGTIVMNIDNFLRPRLVSERAQIHPVFVLIGALGGLKVFGFIGILIGPLVLALFVAFVKFYESAYRKRLPAAM